MIAINDGGPAFPVSTQGKDPEDRSYGHQDSAHTWQYPGLTMRDYLAAKAMQVIRADAQFILRNDPDQVADRAYELADAMLKAREQQ